MLIASPMTSGEGREWLNMDIYPHFNRPKAIESKNHHCFVCPKKKKKKLQELVAINAKNTLNSVENIPSFFFLFRFLSYKTELKMFKKKYEEKRIRNYKYPCVISGRRVKFNIIIACVVCSVLNNQQQTTIVIIVLLCLTSNTFLSCDLYAP